ncbi:MAG: hypothetical protein QOJ51_1420, partial [Acidobacteriaceae bacterium]|nr:hypothetical protein [Acidobacteriaceae bacterium]
EHVERREDVIQNHQQLSNLVI